VREDEDVMDNETRAMIQDSEDRLKGMTVSEGTLRSQDLIPRFLDVLYANGGKLRCELLPEIQEDPGHPFWSDYDEMAECVGDLFEAMQDIAPEGYYFGAHHGDGACFGFWEHCDG
jgi:hypothetical protein